MKVGQTDEYISLLLDRYRVCHMRVLNSSVLSAHSKNEESRVKNDQNFAGVRMLVY